MDTLNFGATSIINYKQFSYVFLADWLLVIIAIVFVIFFLDRALGFILSQIVGWYLWKTQRVYFSVSSVKISFVGGRIFFKNLVYISENQALSILHGSYSWQYWLKRVRRNGLDRCGDGESEQGKGPEFAGVEGASETSEAKAGNRSESGRQSGKSGQSEPSRQSTEGPLSRHFVRLTGVEWFIYNQSSAYVFNEDQPVSPRTSSSSTQSTLASKSDFTTSERLLFHMMPTTFEIDTFSIIFGNQSTSTLMVAYSKSATMNIDVGPPSVACDRYQMVYRSKLVKPKVSFTANYDFDPEIAKTSKSKIAHWYSLQEIFTNVKDHTRVHHKRTPTDEAEDPNKAARFGDDTPAEHTKVSKLLECDALQLDYFYDVPDVCQDPLLPDPQMGYVLEFSNAALNYGPWTERRRVEFYELFFPPKCKTYTPFSQQRGALRQWPRYTTEVKFRGGTTLRIPTREFSKSMEATTLSNAVGDNANDNLPTSAEVPYGWLELVVADGSNLKLGADTLAQKYGFKMSLEANLLKAQIRTSVNHAELLYTDSYHFVLTQTMPLQWNALQTWDFDNVVNGGRIFLLREHINLAVDLTEDLGSGKNIPYELFVPAVYNVDFKLNDIKLFANVNPHNIISSPTSLTENVFLVFNARQLGLEIFAPFDQVAPVSNRISAVASTECLTMDIVTPSWHTLDAFLDSKTVGIAHDFKLEYEITYYAEVDYSRVEEHSIDITAHDFTLVAFGAVIDYLIAIIDNYGGLDFKFQTPQEFAAREFKPPHYSITREGVDVDYRVTSNVENSCFVFPAHLYSAKDNLSLFTESWTADLRFTNYYMDLQTEFSPVRGFINKGLTPEGVLSLHKQPQPEQPVNGINVLRTDELIARAHRMFGLPPSEPTYICKWDFDIGDLALNMPAHTPKILPQIGQCFAHGLANVENRPFFSVFKPADITFVTAAIDSISLKISVPGEDVDNNPDIVNVCTSSVTIKFNDLANPRYSDKIFIDIPSIHVFGSNGDNSILDFTTTLRTTIFTVKSDHQKHYEEQQEHIMVHDSLFHRCPFLLDDKHRSDPRYGVMKSETPHTVPAMPIPSMPPQLTRETLIIIDSEMGQFDYKGNGGGSETASEVSLYGSGGGFNGTNSSSSDLSSSDDGSVIVKRRAKADTAEPGNSKYLSLKEWGMPPNDAKDTKSVPVFPVNWAPSVGDSPHQTTNGGDSVNVVMELGSVEGKVHVHLQRLVANLAEILDMADVEAVMDQLECQLVDDLKKPILKNNLKMLVQVPAIDLTIARDGLRNDADSSHLFVGLSDIQVLGTVTAGGELPKQFFSKNFTASFERIVAGARTWGKEATRIDLSRPQLIFTEDRSGSSVEWRTGTLDFTTKASELEELALFMQELKSESQGSSQGPGKGPSQGPSQGPSRGPKCKIDAASLIYSTLVAGQKAGIEHDPYVLSRTPAVQVTNNIRGDISWRIAMRLRYLLANLPQMEILEPPSDAKQQLLEILEHWRSWERIEPLDHARILAEFEKSEARPTFPKIIVYVESLSTILKYSDTQEDYLVLDEFEIHGGFKKPSDSWTKCLFSVSTQRARLGVTWDVLRLFEVINKVRASSRSNLSTEGHSIPSRQSSCSPGNTIFQGIFSLSIRDWSADIQGKSLKCEFQNKGVQLVTTIDYREAADTLFASGVFRSSLSAIRLYSPQMELELVDYLMERVNVGYSADTTNLKGPLWLAVDVGVLNLAINATFEELCKAAELVLANEVTEIKRLFEAREPAQAAYKAAHKPDSTKSIELLINTNFMVSEFVFKVQAMENCSFAFTGADFALMGRMPEENAVLASIEWESYVLRVLNDDHSLGSFLVKGTKILARADLDAPAFDIKYNVGQVNLETTSILLVFRFMESPVVVEHTKRAVAAFERAVKTAKSVTGGVGAGTGTAVETTGAGAGKSTPNAGTPTAATGKSTHTDTAPTDQIFWNSSFSISQVRISLPVENFSFCFIFDEIMAQHKTFDWTSSGAKISETSFTYVNTSELSAQLIQGSSATKILSIQLLGNYRGVANLSSIYFTSEFCKVVLSPTSVAAIHLAFHKVRANVLNFLPEGGEKKKEASTLLDSFADTKAMVALRDFSVTWITEQHNSSKDSEGITGGFELLEINLANLQCRMDLAGLAITPIATPWKSLEKNRYLNFAHLPHVEIVAMLLPNEKFINVVINGESLHVNLRPSFGILVSAIINSLDKCQESLGKQAGGPTEPPSNTSPGSSPDAMIPKLKATIEGDSGLMEYSLLLKTKFDAATFKLWDDNLPELVDDAAVEVPRPSLELNSPDMLTTVEYQHREDCRDLALVNVHVSESSNQIYPKALQELKALLKFSTTAYDASPFPDLELSGSVPSGSPGSSGSGSGSPGSSGPKSFEALKSEVVSRFLKSVDTTVIISLKEQRLSVSCQPFSRITTTVSTNSVKVLLTTPLDDDHAYISVSGSISRAHLMLQHAHSHERSGFGGVDELRFSVMHKVSGDSQKERIMAGINIEGPEFEIRAAQIKDIELFIDIWNPKKDISMGSEPGTGPGPEPAQPEPAQPDQTDPEPVPVSIGKKYRQLLAEYPMTWTVNVCVNNLVCRADLGASLGRAEILADCIWASAHRQGNTQQLAVGLNTLEVTSEGRLGAQAKLCGVSKRLTTYWEDAEMIPLVQLVVAIDALDISLGIDGHKFLAARATEFRAGYANHLARVSSGSQNLLISAQLKELSIAFTSLVVSNVYDVVEPLNFLRAQTAIYQKALARENNSQNESPSRVVSNILSHLRVRLAAQLDSVRLYVFPTNFDDTNALKLSANTMKFVFDREPTVQNVIPSHLVVETRGYRVGLGTLKPTRAGGVIGVGGSGSQTDLFKRLKDSATSSMLVSIPEATVSMDSTDINGKRVEYIFKSLFGGDLEVGWNLGTLNFIRELYETHERTWLSRVAIKERTILETGKRPRTMKEFMEEVRPEYVPLAPPEIQIPNLHDMGHATPPVEWMGFNRERLPGMTHWFVVRALYKIIGDIERRYAAVLH